MSNERKQIVIIGATSAIAEHCARLWAVSEIADFVLVARDLQKAEIVAADLRVRSPAAEVRLLQVDFFNPFEISQLVDSIATARAIDIALIAHGSLPEQLQCQEDLELASAALTLNGISPTLFAERIALHMQSANRGVLAIIGSVAGDRGRKSNYVYGAAKGMITRYAQGLQHRLANSLVRVVLIKPGPTDTPMTSHLKKNGARLADVGAVAKQIVAGISRGAPMIYAPSKWRLIMMIIRHLPFFIFKKMDI